MSHRVGEMIAYALEKTTSWKAETSTERRKNRDEAFAQHLLHYALTSDDSAWKALPLLAGHGLDDSMKLVELETEVTLPGGNGRVDLQLIYGSATMRRAIRIELKIDAQFSTSQLKRYASAPAEKSNGFTPDVTIMALIPKRHRYWQSATMSTEDRVSIYDWKDLSNLITEHEGETLLTSESIALLTTVAEFVDSVGEARRNLPKDCTSLVDTEVISAMQCAMEAFYRIAPRVSFGTAAVQRNADLQIGITGSGWGYVFEPFDNNGINTPIWMRRRYVTGEDEYRYVPIGVSAIMNHEGLQELETRRGRGGTIAEMEAWVDENGFSPSTSSTDWIESADAAGDILWRTVHEVQLTARRHGFTVKAYPALTEGVYGIVFERGEMLIKLWLDVVEWSSTISPLSFQIDGKLIRTPEPEQQWTEWSARAFVDHVSSHFLKLANTPFAVKN